MSGQQQGDTMGPLLFSLGLQPILTAVQEQHPCVIIRAYIDDIRPVADPGGRKMTVFGYGAPERAAVRGHVS